jgi:hypothetical protein
MMSRNNVISLIAYRRNSRKAYFAKHSNTIDTFLRNFIATNFDFDFRKITDAYQGQVGGDSSMAWDYVDFREVLREAMQQVFGKFLVKEMRCQHWFDPKFISDEQIIDRCLSTFILDQCEYALVR